MNNLHQVTSETMFEEGDKLYPTPKDWFENTPYLVVGLQRDSATSQLVLVLQPSRLTKVQFTPISIMVAEQWKIEYMKDTYHPEEDEEDEPVNEFEDRWLTTHEARLAKEAEEAMKNDNQESNIRSSTQAISEEIARGRIAAHAKHGANSIEAIRSDSEGWLAILAEEGGEVSEVMLDLFAHTILGKALGRVAHSKTYDAEKNNLRSELVDVASVAIAWIASIDRK